MSEDKAPDPKPFKAPTREEIQDAVERDKAAPRPWITKVIPKGGRAA